MAWPGTPCISLAYSLLPYAGPLDIQLYVHLWWSICVHAVYRRYKLNHLWSTYFDEVDVVFARRQTGLGICLSPFIDQFRPVYIMWLYIQHKPLGGGFLYELFDLLFMFDMIFWSNIQHCIEYLPTKRTELYL